ncbi:MAG: HD domain-containing protein [Lachnospiraceae bacterium]|nr:HD domain-containing protein [Lachnospiraceae bacterium]
MKFVKTEDIKSGMRLARPIYSKKGVLLFDRDTVLSSTSIPSIKNFNLLGIYVLEPAEPLPPISEEDVEFERFQTVTVGNIEDELKKISTSHSQSQLEFIVNNIIKKFGHLDGKINFYQNLRSKEDYVYKHALNVAILCTMICNVLNVRVEERQQTVRAALVHDVGKLNYPGESVYGEAEDEDELRRLYQVQLNSMSIIEKALGSEGTAVKRICTQALRKQMIMFNLEENNANMKMHTGAQILLVANRYDEITAMNLQGTAKSEVKAVREFMEHPEIYDPKVVNALLQSINVLFPGVSVELNTGEKAMVLKENTDNILRPMVLSFRDNSILDLSLRIYEDIQVEDIMKTLDNRYVMDNEALRRAGF